MRDLLLSLIRSGGPIEALPLSQEVKHLVDTGAIDRAELESEGPLTFKTLCSHLEALERAGLARMTADGWEYVPQRAAMRAELVDAVMVQGSLF